VEKNVFEQHWQKALVEKRAAGLWRQHRVLTTPQGAEVVVDGKPLLAFCSNDYLGLANHPEVKEAAIQGINRAGVGSGASHLVVGHHEEHTALERELAEFTQRDRALVFSSGYMANLAVVSSLVGKSDIVLEDRLNHASLIDGGLLSGAKFQRFLHGDSASLEKKLSRLSLTDPCIEQKKLVVSDGVFSMDGDIANLKPLSSLCATHNALLMVDDAHGLGVLGPGGRGSVAEQELSQTEVPVLVGTFGKAFGTSGAFVAGSDDLIEYLIQTARPYIYTTAMPPSIVAATRKSLSLVIDSDERRKHLSRLIEQFRSGASELGFQLMASQTPIQPILIGDAYKAVELSKFLESKGLLVTAIRPPTVPNNSARLRVTFSANHTPNHVDQLLNGLKLATQSGKF